MSAGESTPEGVVFRVSECTSGWWEVEALDVDERAVVRRRYTRSLAGLPELIGELVASIEIEAVV